MALLASEGWTGCQSSLFLAQDFFLASFSAPLTKNAGYPAESLLNEAFAFHSPRFLRALAIEMVARLP